MSTSQTIVIDCVSGTFFDASQAVTVSLDSLSEDDLAVLDNGSDSDIRKLAARFKHETF